MERLTEKIINKETGKVLAYRLKSGGDRIKADTKLGQYEDAQEQGVVLNAPCKAGDKAYLIDKDENGCLKVYEGVWESVSLTQRKIGGDFELCGHISYDVYDFFYDDGRTMKHGMYVGQEQTKFGKVVFLTKEEAEQALKRINGK